MYEPQSCQNYLATQDCSNEPYSLFVLYTNLCVLQSMSGRVEKRAVVSFETLSLRIELAHGHAETSVQGGTSPAPMTGFPQFSIRPLSAWSRGQLIRCTSE